MTVVSFRKRTAVTLVTTHGRVEIEALSQEETLLQLLCRSGIPWSAVSIFSVDDENRGTLVASLDTPMSELAGASEVLIHFNRNVNPLMFSVLSHERSDAAAGPNVSDYVYQHVDNASGSVENTLKGLSAEECRRAVAQQVHRFLAEHCRPNERIVVGISGGGDSNALLMAMTSFVGFPLDIRPVILQGIADWDAGVPRARELCEQYGLSLEVVSDARVRQIAGLRDKVDLVQKYESLFPGDDFEFLGTLLIRKVLTQMAKDLGTDKICTGLNMEDVLCESLYRVSAGRAPLSFPTRPLGDVTVLYPLWLCPKKIIDGCFPKYSIENYAMRYPCFSVGRNLYYMMAYTLQSQFPGAVERLLFGLKALAELKPASLTNDVELDTLMERDVPADVRRRFSQLMVPRAPARWSGEQT